MGKTAGESRGEAATRESLKPLTAEEAAQRVEAIRRFWAEKSARWEALSPEEKEREEEEWERFKRSINEGRLGGRKIYPD